MTTEQTTTHSKHEGDTLTVLTLAELQQLKVELEGLRDPATGEQLIKGLLAEQLPLPVKYRLVKVARQAEAESKLITEFSNELIRRLGSTDENGDSTLPYYLPKGEDAQENVPNPAMAEFNREMSALLDQSYTLAHAPFRLQDFAHVDTTANLPVFFRLIAEE
jgi:hypothetical protein